MLEPELGKTHGTLLLCLPCVGVSCRLQVHPARHGVCAFALFWIFLPRRKGSSGGTQIFALPTGEPGGWREHLLRDDRTSSHRVAAAREGRQAGKERNEPEPD